MAHMLHSPGLYCFAEPYRMHRSFAPNLQCIKVRNMSRMPHSGCAIAAAQPPERSQVRAASRSGQRLATSSREGGRGYEAQGRRTPDQMQGCVVAARLACAQSWPKAKRKRGGVASNYCEWDSVPAEGLAASSAALERKLHHVRTMRSLERSLRCRALSELEYERKAHGRLQAVQSDLAAVAAHGVERAEAAAAELVALQSHVQHERTSRCVDTHSSALRGRRSIVCMVDSTCDYRHTGVHVHTIASKCTAMAHFWQSTVRARI